MIECEDFDDDAVWHQEDPPVDLWDIGSDVLRFPAWVAVGYLAACAAFGVLVAWSINECIERLGRTK